MRTLDDRLIELGHIVKSRDFQLKRGTANEVPYYIFDYQPQYELDVCDYIHLLAKEMNYDGTTSPLYVFDLYDIIMELFEQKNFLRYFDQIEESDGIAGLARQINSSLRITNESGKNYVTDYIIRHTPRRDGLYPVVCIVGIGKCFPLIRSHTILNFMHLEFSDVPVIAMFPGTYDGQYLKPFGTIPAENYYRAFKLVP